MQVTNAATVGPQPISNLSTMEVAGTASLSQDTVYFSYLDSGVSKIKANSQDSLLGLAQGWKYAEYNIFGIGGAASVATFNPGSSIVVAMNAWAFPPGGGIGQPPSPIHPTMCVSGAAPTAEWNSLNLFGGCCPYPVNGFWFFESNTDATNRPPAGSLNPIGSSCCGNDNCLSGICSNGICSVPPTTPTRQASSLLFMPPYEYSPGMLETAVGWQNGDGEATAVFVAAVTSSGSNPPPPLVDVTIYLQNVISPSDQGVDLSTFGQGSQIGNTGWYCVYNGTGTYVTLLGLESAVSYVVMAVTYNGYSVGVPVYLTSMAQNNPQNYPPPAAVSVPATPAAGVAALAVILCATGMIRVSSRKSLSKAAGRRA
jgi:hypothetical protein